MKTNINKPYKVILDILLSIMCAILAYIFYLNISLVLSTDKLLYFDNFPFALVILTILTFTFLIVFLTFEVLISKFKPAIFLTGLAFIPSQNFSLISVGLSLLIIGSLWIFSHSFFSDLDNFKRPSISRCFNSSIGFGVTFIAIILVGNFFPLYQSIIYSPEVKISDQLISLVTKYTGGNDNSELTAGDPTLREYTINSLHKQKAPLTVQNISTAMDQIKTQLNIEASETDKMSTIYKHVINQKITQLVKENRFLALIVVLMTYYFLAEVLLKFSTSISGTVIWIVQHILKFFHIYLVEEEIKTK